METTTSSKCLVTELPLYRKRTNSDYNVFVAVAFQMFKRLAPNLAMKTDKQIESHVLELLPNCYRPSCSL